MPHNQGWELAEVRYTVLHFASIKCTSWFAPLYMCLVVAGLMHCNGCRYTDEYSVTLFMDASLAGGGTALARSSAESYR